MIYGKIGPFPPGNVAENVANLRKGKDEVIAMQQKRGMIVMITPQKPNNNTKKKHPCVFHRGVSAGADDRI